MLMLNSPDLQNNTKREVIMVCQYGVPGEVIMFINHVECQVKSYVDTQ